MRGRHTLVCRALAAAAITMSLVATPANAATENTDVNFHPTESLSHAGFLDRIHYPDPGYTPQRVDRSTFIKLYRQAEKVKAANDPPVGLGGWRDATVCRTIWPTPHELCGAILEKYDAPIMKWLGVPVTGMIQNPDGRGYRAGFTTGTIYWSPETGAWSVNNEFMKAWGRKGYEAGPLGYPTSDAVPTLPAVGFVQTFQHGRIFGSLQHIASVQGLIDQKYKEYGSEQGTLGFPVHDETGTPDGRGRFNRFDNGMIYWTPDTGAHPILGTVLEQWSNGGFERSRWGYPVGDPIITDGISVHQDFQYGSIDGYTSEIAELASLSQEEGAALPLPEFANYAKEILVGRVRDIPGALRNEIAWERLSRDYLQRGGDEGTGNREARVDAAHRQDRSADPNDGASGYGYPEWKSKCSAGEFTPPGNANTIKGDLFFSYANHYHFEHGHNGIFVNDPASTTRDSDSRAARSLNTVEAVNKSEGVKFLRGNDRIGTCQAKVLRVRRATPDDRNKAVDYALHQVGKPYDTNYAFSRVFPSEEKFNCSTLVWQAYRHTPSDIDVALNPRKHSDLVVSNINPDYTFTRMGILPFDILNSDEVDIVHGVGN